VTEQTKALAEAGAFFVGRLLHNSMTLVT